MTTPNSTEHDAWRQGLAARFQRNMHRHPGLAWEAVWGRLEGHPEAQASLQAMDATSGEPDVIGEEAGRLIFCDCSPQSPDGRLSTCYDADARTTRKEHPPHHSALEMAAAMGFRGLLRV